MPLQPPRSIALYIDGDNQSPAIASDLLASLRHDWGLEISSVAVAGNDHGQSVSRWQTALAEWLPEDRILALHVPKTPEAADLALILELGAAMERHREGPDLVVVVSRDEWLIGAGEAVRARGCRVWVAYAQSEVPPARTHLPTLLLPAVHRGQASTSPHASAKTPAASLRPALSASTVASTAAGPTVKPKEAAPPAQPSRSHTKLLDQVRARCQAQPGGGYRASAVGQALYELGLTDKTARIQFLKAIPGLREVGTGGDKRLIL